MESEETDPTRSRWILWTAATFGGALLFVVAMIVGLSAGGGGGQGVIFVAGLFVLVYQLITSILLGKQLSEDRLRGAWVAFFLSVFLFIGSVTASMATLYAVCTVGR